MLAKPWNRQKRINEPVRIDEVEIEGLINDGYLTIVQFSKPCFDRAMLAILDRLCKKYDTNFGVRFYGFYSDSFDFRTLRFIPSVKNLAVDCLLRAEHVDVLAELENLQFLNFGVFEMKDPSLLSFPNLRNLRQLILQETRSKSYDLQHLRYFENLESLTIDSHTKNIAAIGELKKLKYLGLSSIKKTGLEFVNSLKSLKSLFIILGGRPNINEIGENEIEELEIIWVRGFNELSNVERFRKLRKLYVEDQIKLEAIGFGERMDYLSELWITNCKNFTSLTGLVNLPSLEKLHLAMTSIEFSSFIEQTMPESLKNIGFFTGNQKRNDRINTELRRHGFET